MAAIKDILAEPTPEAPAIESKPVRERSDEQIAHTPQPEAVHVEDDNSPNKAGADTSNSTSLRRNPNGSVSSVYSGNKMKHLKKEDGIPLWRKDIQYDFLKLVFYNETKCFTKYGDGTKDHTFAEVYIDAMAKSSKTSQILKEKLLQNHLARLTRVERCVKESH